MLSASGSRELRATALAMKVVARDVRSAINKGTRQTMNPVWRDAVAAQARTAMDTRVISKGARIAAGNPPTAIAASSTKALSGGFTPAVHFAAFEFGAAQSKQTTYTSRSSKGKAYKVTRHTTHQLPAFTPKGRVAYAVLGKFGHRLAALWVQTVVRMIYEASEGR
jgi:hypothetical protein